MSKLAIIMDLFIRFIKIGLVGFGGGWAILPIIQREIVEEGGYLDEGEFYDLIAIAGSTPGPVAVNAATYVGYKVAGLTGAFFATLGVVIPPFTIISLIAYGLTQYLSNRLIQALLKGLKGAIIGLIAIVLYSTFKSSINDLSIAQSIILLSISTIVVFLIVYLKLHPIIAILLAGLVGLLLGVLKVW